MIALIVISVLELIVIVILTIALVLSSYFAIKYGRMILRWEDNIEESLDVLDVAYQKMSDILRLPLASASPEIRGILTEITNCREAVLWLANAVNSPATDGKKKYQR